MDHFQSDTANTTVIYFPLINQRFVRKNDIDKLTHHRCDQEDIDKVLNQIEKECDFFEQKRRMLGRNRLCLAFFVICFISGLTTVMISSGVSTSIGFYVGIGVVTLALFVVLLILLFNRMLNRIEEHYFQVIQSNLELSNQKIERGGAHWNTKDINLNYLELQVTEDNMVMKQMFGNILMSKLHHSKITEKDKNEGTQPTDRNAARRSKNSVRQAAGQPEAHRAEGHSEESEDNETDEDDEEDDDEEGSDEESDADHKEESKEN